MNNSITDLLIIYIKDISEPKVMFSNNFKQPLLLNNNETLNWYYDDLLINSNSDLSG